MRLLEGSIRNGCATLLLVIQALGGGTIALAHARDVVLAPPAVEAAHDGRCPILHDGPRCALCQYAGARIVAQDVVVLMAERPARACSPSGSRPVAVPGDVRRTPPSRAPPTVFS